MDITVLNENIIERIRSTSTIHNLSHCVIELVQNSLDARATSIAIRLNLKTYQIQVIDNGQGISRTNLEHVGIQYMTSKCQKLDDLSQYLKSYGYKGESLWAISQISKTVQISSRLKGTKETFTKILKPNRELVGDILLVALRPSCGTTVTVSGFLFNLPVRQRAMKINEFEIVRRHLENLVIIHPQVSFTLRDDSSEKLLMNITKHDSIIEAFKALNPEIANHNLEVIKVSKHKTSVEALLDKEFISSKKLQLIYVNRRLVTDQNLLKLVLNSFCKPEGNPVFIIQIKVPYNDVDFLWEVSKSSVLFTKYDLVKACIEKLFNKFSGGEKRDALQEMEVFPKPFGLSQLQGAMKGTAIKKEEVVPPLELVETTLGESCQCNERRGKDLIMEKFIKSVQNYGQESEPTKISVGVQTESIAGSCNRRVINFHTTLSAPDLHEPDFLPFQLFKSHPKKVRKQNLDRSLSDRPPEKLVSVCEEASSDLFQSQRETQTVNDLEFTANVLCDSPALSLKPKFKIVTKLANSNLARGTKSPFFPAKAAKEAPKFDFGFSLQTQKSLDLTKTVCRIVQRSKRERQSLDKDVSHYFTPSSPLDDASHEIIESEDVVDKMQICKKTPHFLKSSRVALATKSPYFTAPKLKKKVYEPKLLQNNNLFSQFVTPLQKSPKFTFNPSYTPCDQLDEGIAVIPVVPSGESKMVITLDSVDKEEIIANDLLFEQELNKGLITQLPDTQGWIREVNNFGTNVYTNVNTGLHTLFTPQRDEIYGITERISFVPKGLSPILKQSPEVDPMTSQARGEFHDAIIGAHDDELLTVKWQNYLGDKDIKQFFDEIYGEKSKKIETPIPRIVRTKVGCTDGISFDKNIFKKLIIIGQVDFKFIVTLEKRTNLLVIFDQHAVDERVRVESLTESYRGASIRIKQNITIFLPYTAHELLEPQKSNLQNLGLVFDLLTNGITISEIPAPIYKKFFKTGDLVGYIEEFVKEIINILQLNNGILVRTPELLQNLINSEACHGAIKFGDPLTFTEIEIMFKNLSKCKLPFQCAHGRPTISPLLSLGGKSEARQGRACDKLNFKNLFEN